MQEITWKLYSPLQADFFPQEVYEDIDRMNREGPMDLNGESLTEYADAIRNAVKAHAENLAEYIHEDRMPALKEKVSSIELSVVLVEEELMGCATVKLREVLNTEETTALRDYLTGQYADGWGEGFEQREIAVHDGVLFLHFWNSEHFGIEIDRNPQAETSRLQSGRAASTDKYEITGIAHPQYPWLHRIRALRDVGADVHAGDLGGYVQGPDNLSQDGNCWVYDNAIVCEDALVSKDARICGEAVIRGSALVSWEAVVTDHAVVEDNAIITAGEVCEGARISGNARIGKSQFSGYAPLVTEQATVYGEVYGSVEIRGTTLILPGIKLDFPTQDTLKIKGSDIRICRSAEGEKVPSRPAKPPRRIDPER